MFVYGECVFLVTVVFGFEFAFCAAMLSEAQRLIGLQVACHFYYCYWCWFDICSI